VRQVYDLIYEYEGIRVTEATTLQAFGAAKAAAFQSKGVFALQVYNFVSEQNREVAVQMPPGLPNAILGIASSILPVPAGALLCCCCSPLSLSLFVSLSLSLSLSLNLTL
jgi:hypothetical protein